MCREGGCLILPQSGYTLPEVTQKLTRGWTERWDWKDGDPLLNYPIGTLKDEGMSLGPPLPPQQAVAPLFC